MTVKDIGRWVSSGTLYVVATPLGNLADISQRALSVLAHVDMIACEDTRHSGKLLAHFGISTPRVSLHAYNEASRVAGLIKKLQQGESVALISDAGTPLISDPGFELVRAARAAGVPVSPIPGASALVTALSAAGLPADRFAFEGFLPAKTAARRQRLASLAASPYTLIFYEAPHRLSAMLDDLLKELGGDREAVIARELTKLHESFYAGTLADLQRSLRAEDIPVKGEFVVMVAGSDVESGDVTDEEVGTTRLIEALLSEGIAPKVLVRALVKATGQPRNALYQRVMALKGESENDQ